MTSLDIVLLACFSGPSCLLQDAPPDPAPVRAMKATAMLAPHDLKQVVRQAPDGSAQPTPPSMALIPAGDTVVGTDPAKVAEYGQNASDKMRDVAGETPRHTVTVPAFYIDLTEVTNLQWKTYLDATHRHPTPTLVSFNWPDGKIPEGQEHYPVTNVNFPEIRDYLHWCGKRLPTEDEWTRAARGDDDRLYPWGSTWNSKLCHSGTSGADGPIAVGSMPEGASPFGVLDMVGNVFEWVDSPFKAFEGFKPYELKQGRKTMPLSPSFNSTFKIIKGGGFSTVRLDSRIDTRLGYNAVNSDAGVGFRAARSELTGVDVLRHALDRLLPPVFSKPDSIDLQDVFAKEVSDYDPSRRVLTSYRYLAFAHRAPSRLPPLSKVRDESVNEPLALGVLTTSEPIVMKDMPVPKGNGTRHAAGAVTVLAPGQFTLAFKGKGASKAFKDKLRAEKRQGGKATGPASEVAPSDETGDSGAADQPAAAATDEASIGAMVPWPGVGSIHDIQEDVDFPQEEDIFLFYNANNVVVAWMKCETLAETDVKPLSFQSSDEGHTWMLEFSVNSLTKKGPRFTLPIQLGGDGLR